MDKEENSKKRIALSTVSTILCLIVLSILYAGFINYELRSERKRYSYIAKNEAKHIITTFDCVMVRTNTLMAMLQDHNGDTSFQA